MSDPIASSLTERLASHAHLMRPLLPTYIHLLASAVFPIFIAAHASLTRPSSAAPKSKKDAEDSYLDEETEPVQKIESLSPSDAVLFPLLAGGTLASLYFILKWLQDPAWLNYILGLYFSQLGLFFAFKFLKDGFTVLRSVAFPTVYSNNGRLYRVNAKDRKYAAVDDSQRQTPVPGVLSAVPLPARLIQRLWSLRNALYTRKQLDIHLQDIFKFKSHISLLDVLALAISLVIVGWHTFISKPWPLTNFLGFSFCYGALQFTTPTTAWTGTLILAALFFYDIYFVFFTPMMVTVATKLDVPIKLLFPRPDGCVYPLGVADETEAMKEYLLCKAKKKTMAMLGLGDVVVPGMVMAFALRFDLYLYYLRKQSQDGERVPFTSATGAWGERFWTSTSSNGKLAEALKARSFPKVYFYATVVGYLLGLVVTVLVMQIWGHAQPALLYLVPGVLGAFWGTALVRGEVGLLWRYTEAGEEQKKEGEERGGKEEEKGQAEGGEKADEDGVAEEKKDL